MSVLIIVVLAVICLAFIGIFGRFPDEWEWVGIVLAGFGLAMATPSIFQMFWGRAVVELQFEVYPENSERALAIFFKNPTVKSRILRMLGVKREVVQSLTAEIRISDVGSNTIIVPIRQARIYSDDDPSDSGNNRIVLPPTYSVGASIMVAHWDNQQKRAIIPPDRRKQPLPLGEGCYRADIIIIVDGDPRIISRQFVVGKEADDLIWASKNSPTPDKEGSQS